MGLLTNKVAIVTGGTRGIGKGIVTKFVAEGAKVVFTYRSSDAEAYAMVTAIGEDKVKAIKSDASKMDQAQALIQSTLDHFGQIDILVNNAGITRDNLMLRMTEEQWDEVIDIN